MLVNPHNNKKLTKKEKRKLKLNGCTQLDTNHGLKLRQILPLTANQSKIINSFNQGKDLLIHGTAGTGKAQPLDCKVKIPGGWKRIGDIQVGDTVVCPDGSLSKVVGVYPQGIKPVYEVTFYDDRKTECCDEHLWTITTKNIANSYFCKETVSLNYIRSLKLKTSKIGIPLINHQYTDNYNFPLHPYLLGALLGDGGITNHVILSSSDIEIIENIRNLGYDISKIPSGKYEYSIKNIIHLLKDLNLIGCKSENKFIPKTYLEESSYEQKIQLIQGLIDTDGYVDKGGCVSFTTTSLQLKEDFVYLIRSVGGTAKTSFKEFNYYTYKGNRKRGLPSWTVSVRHRNIEDFLSLERKKERIKKNHQYKDSNLKFKKIELIGEKECVCISIDHPDMLYITDDFIVTHNTFIGSFLALHSILNEEQYDQLVIFRSTVPTRDMGFLPGNKREKVRQYETPYIDICAELFGRGDAYAILEQKKIIHFEPTAFLRGLTFRNSVMLVDEIQNMNWQELSTVLTRVGDNCRVILCGDLKQPDLLPKDGRDDILKLFKVCEHMNRFANIQMGIGDIVRSGFVKDFIISCERLGY